MKKTITILTILTLITTIGVAHPRPPRHAPPPVHHHHHSSWVAPVVGLFAGLVIGASAQKTKEIVYVEKAPTVISTQTIVRKEIRHSDGRIEVIEECY